MSVPNDFPSRRRATLHIFGTALLLMSLLLSGHGPVLPQESPIELVSDFTPPKGRGHGPGESGPWVTRLMSATSPDGLVFTRTGAVITDQGDVPDLVVDSRGWLYLYYVGWTVGSERNRLVVAISRDEGRSWVYKKAVLSGFEGMSDPVDPDVQILPDGTFRLYVTCAIHGQPPRTWHADSADGLHFHNRGVAFDPPGVPLDPSTLVAGSTWHIFAGGETRQPGANWHGTSVDGSRFVFDREMVFVKDGLRHAVSNGIPVPGGYRFYAFSHTLTPVINSFFSPDGVEWSPEPGARLEMDPSSGLESGRVKDAAVAQLPGGSYFMVYVTRIPEAVARPYHPELYFVPDPGIRVDSASLPKPSVDPSGTVHLYYEDHGVSPPRELRSASTDGLVFPPGELFRDRAHDPRRLLLPDGIWRLYLCDQRVTEFRSSSSTDGLHFTPDPGVRYRPQPKDMGTIGVYDHFTDSAGVVVLLYIGDMKGLNNVRRAYSPPGDNGWTFTYEHGNVLGDAGDGGGPASYVDQKSIRLPDGRIRLFTMKRGAVFSFLSEDEGRTFQLEPGVRLAPSDFSEFKVVSFHDPWGVRLPGGRYRMYVAAALESSPGRPRFAIVSATTPPPAADRLVTGGCLMSLHACDPSVANCRDPRNHLVLLAESNDGAVWSRVPGWIPYSGSVPDLIRRGGTLYVYSSGEVLRCRFDTNVIEFRVRVTVSDLPGGFVDPSLILDEQGRLVLFLYGRPGGDPAGCPPEEPSCVLRFGSATEVADNDGTRFRLDPGDRAAIVVDPSAGLRSASDPDIFHDGSRYILHISHGAGISVWASSELRGAYRKIADLSQTSGGVPSGHFDAASGRYWTYAHVVRDAAARIRLAAHPDFSRVLTEADWRAVLTAEDLGLPVTANLESPGFAVNLP